MKEDWVIRYRAALMERIPALQQLRVEEAYKAVMGAMKEADEGGERRQKLNNAINILDRLRNRP